MRKLIYILLFPILLFGQLSNDEGTKNNSFQIGRIIVTPDYYGARANGIVDDHIAIHKADLRADSGTVMFSNGIYNLSGDTLIIGATQAIEFSTRAVLDSGVLIVRGSFIAPIKKVFGNYLTVDLDSAKITYSYPEWWGANGVNDLTALTNCFRGSLNKKVFLSQDYNVNGKVQVNCSNKNIDIVSFSGCRIINTNTSGDSGYYTPEGNFKFMNANKVTIYNVEFVNSSTALSYLEGLLIENANEVKLDKVTSKHAGQSGIRTQLIQNLSIDDCIADSNKYAGLLVVGCKEININGGHYSYNGTTAPTNGYGIALSHQFGTGEDNENATIQNVTANYNLRKGLDAHDCIKLIMAFNKVKGFVNAGLYAVDEGGSAALHLKYVKDVQIVHNIVENDSVWFAGLSFASSAMSHPIQVGSYLDVQSDGGEGGVFKVSDNIIRNCRVRSGGTDYLAKMISCIGGAMQSLEVINNTLEQGTCENAIQVSSNDYNQPQVVKIVNNVFLNVTSTSEIIQVTLGAEIYLENNKLKNCTGTYGLRAFQYGTYAAFHKVVAQGNSIDGSFTYYGIHVNNGDQIRIDNNDYSGTFSGGKCFYVESDLRFSAFNNTYLVNITPTPGASINLPDYYSKSQGKVCYAIETSSSPTTLDALTLNVAGTAYGGYDGGSCIMDITITTGLVNNQNYCIYKAQATAGNVSGTPYTSTTKMTGMQIAGNFVSYRPTLGWTTSGYERTLQITLPDSYTSYFVEITFGTWRLIPYQKVN